MPKNPQDRLAGFDPHILWFWTCRACGEAFDIAYECYAHERNAGCVNNRWTRVRRYHERKARLTGEYLRHLVEAEQYEAMCRLDSSQEKKRKISSSGIRKCSRIKKESDADNSIPHQEHLSDTDSDSDAFTDSDE